MKIFPSNEKGFLAEVFGGVPIARRAEGDGVDGGGVAGHEFGEGGDVAVLCRGCEFGVGVGHGY